MSKFLCISNQGEIPLHGIRLLGHSGKGKDKIGQFGTGLKEALALALRMKLEFVIFSGMHRIDFGIQQIDGVDEVCFRITSDRVLSEKYAVDVWHGMGFSPALGSKDWDSAWQILREVVCNAFDEGDMEIGTDREPSGALGRTRVYITMSEAIQYEYEQLSDKLLFLRGIDCSGARLAIPHSVGDHCKIYCKGVFVKRANYRSIFDYNFNELQLTESRTVDWTEVNRQIARMMQEDADYWGVVMKHMANQDLVETAYISSWLFEKRKGEQMRGGFYSTYGARAVPCSDSQMAERLVRKGYVPVTVTEAMKRILDESGIQVDVLAKHYSKGFRPTISSARTDRRFEKLWKELAKAHLTMGKPRPVLRVFVGEGTTAMLEAGQIWINEQVVGTRQEIHHMLREIAHYLVGSDCDTSDTVTWMTEALITLGGFGKL